MQSLICPGFPSQLRFHWEIGLFITGVDSPEVNRIQRKLEKPRDEFLCVANKHWKS